MQIISVVDWWLLRLAIVFLLFVLHMTDSIFVIFFLFALKNNDKIVMFFIIEFIYHCSIYKNDLLI